MTEPAETTAIELAALRRELGEARREIADLRKLVEELREPPPKADDRDEPRDVTCIFLT